MSAAAPIRLRRAIAADTAALRAILYDTFESTWLGGDRPGRGAGLP